ncbi:alpha-L-fucosidase [Flavobacterium algicola]|uniref:alpha-L-fucosidase n=1 Tax=Flavobacterium algicola TaxID=556529 RepID=UPI001EFD4B10|nr:alpha-L-fucosidase [Flavobacterium algicola]MCG9792331.1 alpha-L-fucosidase [Flavobacterium algicola]
MNKIIVNLLLISISILHAQDHAKKETAKEVKIEQTFEYRFAQDLKQTPDSEARLNQWYKDAKFGAFIHFGVYSTLEGEYKGRGSEHRYSEWIQVSAKIPASEYYEVASRFNPSEFNAEEWVKVFKNAGMRYVVLTSKHHDGFAMFKSNVSNYNIVDATPFKRDVVKELSEACHRNGLKFGVYYSHAQDWDNPNAPLLNNKASIFDLHPELPTNFKADFDKYIKEKSLPQVEELVKNYDIDLIWFDTPAQMTYERAKLFSDMVQKYRPNCLINSRIIHNGKSKIEAANLPLFDYVSIGDKEVPTKKLPLYVESPDCVSSSFGYKTKGNVYYHTEKEMINRMVHTVCTGGNYLLNNGPMGNGALDPEAIRLYGVIGDWMKMNGESIIATLPNPFASRPVWGDVSTNKNGDVLYLHVLEVPKSGIVNLPDLSVEVESANYLASDKTVIFKQDGKKVKLIVSKDDSNVVDLVIKIMLKGPVEK